MQMEMWLLIPCKFKSLSKHNGLNFPFFFFWEGREKIVIRSILWGLIFYQQ